MRLRGGVADEAAAVAGFVARALRRPLAGGEQRAQRGAGRRVLQHRAALAAGAKTRWQIARGGEPVEHAGFEFGTRGARLPQHALHAERRAQQLRQHGRGRGVGREIREKSGRLPVGEAGHYDAVEIGEHVFERLGGLGRRRRERVEDIARSAAGQHGEFGEPRVVADYPLREGVELGAESLRLEGVRDFACGLHGERAAAGERRRPRHG